MVHSQNKILLIVEGAKTEPRVFEQIENGKKYFSSDGLHPNDLGHEIIANELYQFLLKV